MGNRPPITFLAFFLMWAELQRWDVPLVHARACEWLEHRGTLAVMRCFRGFAKSTILAVYNAWRFYGDASYRILHQGDQDKTAYKTSRDTKAVLRRHPLTRQRFQAIRGEAAFWWVPEAADERNPSMQAAGITSNITSSRCDEAQNDDVEVPRNIQNPEARDKMRFRLGEQTHCMVPGARQLFVGTPHTHDSLYDEMEALGADCLTIPMFEREHRIDDARAHVHAVPFEPEMVFAGIGRSARLLDDWTWANGKLTLEHPPGGMVDCYSGSAWPKRFNAEEMLGRRKKCKTINEWDSQYQLHSRPIHQIRLDPTRLRAYVVEPLVRQANGTAGMWLGQARIVSAACRWDPASGKLRSDVSALAIILCDEFGNRYWHRAIPLTGEVAEFAEDGKTIKGGQVFQIVAAVREFALRRVTVENNGVGLFAPTVLRAALTQAGIRDCGVSEQPSTTNKNRAILEAFEGPLTSGKLWAHSSVVDGPAAQQMRDWNPAITDQADDYIDAGAKALAEAPERIGRVSAGLITPAGTREDWTPGAGVHEVELES